MFNRQPNGLEQCKSKIKNFVAYHRSFPDEKESRLAEIRRVYGLLEPVHQTA